MSSSSVETAQEIVFRWGNLKKFQEDLDMVRAQAAEVEKYAKEQVFDKSGFDYRLCVLQPLADMMDTLGDVFTDLRTTFEGRWDTLTEALEMTANEQRLVDTTQAAGYGKGRYDVEAS